MITLKTPDAEVLIGFVRSMLDVGPPMSNFVLTVDVDLPDTFDLDAYADALKDVPGVSNVRIEEAPRDEPH